MTDCERFANAKRALYASASRCRDAPHPARPERNDGGRKNAPALSDMRSKSTLKASFPRRNGSAERRLLRKGRCRRWRTGRREHAVSRRRGSSYSPVGAESFGGKIHRAGILKRRASTTRKTNLRRALTQSLNFAPWRAASLALLGPYSGRFRGASVKSARASALMKHPLLCNRSIVTTWS